jgi:hypothetical protein
MNKTYKTLRIIALSTFIFYMWYIIGYSALERYALKECLKYHASGSFVAGLTPYCSAQVNGTIWTAPLSEAVEKSK